MIERHVTFKVYPDKTDEFVKLFVEEYRPAMSKMPGFVRVELLVEKENSNHFQMLICFEDLESSTAWRNSPEHQSLSPKIKSFYRESNLQVYEVVA